MIKSKCKNCGREKEYKYKSWVRPFCSYTCKMQHMWLEKKEGQYKPCPQCKKKVYLQPRFFNKTSKYYGDLKFCSRECWIKYRKGKSYADPEKLRGHKAWNKGKKMSDEFRDKCRIRQKKMMQNQDYKKNIMDKIDFDKLAENGKIALKKWREENPEEYKIACSKAGKIIHERFLKKLGVKVNEN